MGFQWMINLQRIYFRPQNGAATEKSEKRVRCLKILNNPVLSFGEVNFQSFLPRRHEGAKVHEVGSWFAWFQIVKSEKPKNREQNS